MDHDLSEMQAFASTPTSQYPPAASWPDPRADLPDPDLAYRLAVNDGAPQADGQGLLHAIDALEELHRTMPYEFARLGALHTLPIEARDSLVALLSLPGPAREAVLQVLTLPTDLRQAVSGIVRLPADVQNTLRVLLS